MADFWTSEDPDLQFVSYTQQSDKDCYIVFKAISSTYRLTKVTSVEYSTNGVDYDPMTDLFAGEGDDMTSLTASPGGTNHTFAWDSNLDLGNDFAGAVRVRFTIENHNDDGDPVTVVGAWFDLDFAPPICSVGWPKNETISDTTPTLQRNATDDTPPIWTEWYVDDDPAFGDANGRRQYKAYSVDNTFTTTPLAGAAIWYFKIRCKDSSVSANESDWSSGSFILSAAILPYQIRVGGTTVIPIIVTDTSIEIDNRLREYESDADFDEGGANIVETRYRNALRVVMECVDGTPYATLAQLFVWKNAKTGVLVEDIGGSLVGVGGLSIIHVPSTWKILNIHIINRPAKAGIIWYSAELEEAT